MTSPTKLVISGLAVLAVAASAVGALASPARVAAGHACVVATGSGDAPFVRNFNPYNQSVARDFTQGGIYETLVDSTSFGGGNIYKILAKSYAYSKDGKTLNVTIQPNVKWSDGSPLTIDDVVYSLTAGKQDKAMDRIGYVEGNVKSVAKTGKYSLAIHFKQVDSTFVGSVLGLQFIVPKKVFSKVKDITSFTNENPIGSGPFTQITRFNSQDYVLSKNPHFWQKGKPNVPCLERIAASGNDAALLQIVSGQADWTHNFVPNVEKAYIARDPKHYHASYLPVGLPISLYFDLNTYPYSVPGFRKAISLAIDRKSVSKLGEYGYAPPVNALGLEDAYPKWIPKDIKARADKMAAYDPAAAKKAFTAAGFTYKDGKLYDPKGTKVSFQIHVIGTWSDWVASNQIIVKNLQAVGVDASVKLEPDWSAWQPNAMSTKFVTLLWSNGAQDMTPYAYFFSHMDPSSNLGPGVDATATGDWEHFQSTQAASLLKQFKGTLDTTKQKAIARQLETIWLDNLPGVPLFVGPRWSTYSTKYWTGFPTYKDPYVDPIFSQGSQVEVILLRLKKATS
jgi:peptide/nickel transport system substrate-binding protein